MYFRLKNRPKSALYAYNNRLKFVFETMQTDKYRQKSVNKPHKKDYGLNDQLTNTDLGLFFYNTCRSGNGKKRQHIPGTTIKHRTVLGQYDAVLSFVQVKFS